MSEIQMKNESMNYQIVVGYDALGRHNEDVMYNVVQLNSVQNL